jgi:outer membrane beta-barrel protein
VEGNTLQVIRNDSAHELRENADPGKKAENTAQNGVKIRELRPISDEGPDHWSARIRFGFVFFALFWLLLVGAMWSRAANADDGSSSSSDSSASSGDEYSFKWLDPEKKIYVLQNRRYTKAGHVLISAMGGPGFSNPYRNTWSLQPRMAYYFSEDWGIEGFYSKVFNSENNTYQGLVSTGSQVFPVIRETRSEVGALIHWVPWYAKINVFNSILYFDWYFSGGVGSVNTAVTTGTGKANLTDFVTQDEMGLFVGTGHQYHISETFTVRLDFMGTYYRAPLAGQTGDNVWFSNYDFTFGLGIRL